MSQFSMNQKIILIIIFFLAFHSSLFSFNNNKKLTQYIYDKWTIEDGLPQNSVVSIIQSDDGYLWFGTQEGLVRYDGISFKIFDKNNTKEITANNIVELLKDKEGNIWIGTDGGGIVKLTNGTFFSIADEKGKTDQLIRSLFQDSKGNIWVGTKTTGMFRIIDDTLHYVSCSNLLDNTIILSITEGKDGVLYIGTFNNGIYKYDNEKLTILKASSGVLPDKLRILYTRKNGNLLIGTSKKGLYSYNDGVVSPVINDESLQSDSVYSIYEDSDEILWIGRMYGGLSRIKNGKISSLNQENGFQSGIVKSIFEDHEGSLWIGISVGGLNRLRSGKFTHYTTSEGLSKNMIITVFVDRKNNIWAGTFDGGLNKIAGNKITVYKKEDGLSNNLVRGLYEDGSGNIWIGTNGSGFCKFDGNRFHCFDKSDGLTNNRVRTFHQDKNGYLWIGTAGGGICRFKDGVVTPFKVNKDIDNDIIFCITETKDGNLWFGTRLNGVVRYDFDNVIIYTTTDGLSSNAVYSIFEDSKDNLWFGSRGGLILYKDGKFKSYSVKDGLYSDLIFSIKEDNDNHLWMSSNKGITRINMSDFILYDNSKLDKIRMRVFGIADGMLAHECNGGSTPSSFAHRDKEGQVKMLYFSTIKGISYINPDDIYLNDKPPHVNIEQVFLNNKSIPVKEKMVFKPGNNNINIEYSALSYIYPKAIRYRYRLFGYDKEWTELPYDRRFVSYTNLDPGKYKFKVIACNNDGIWNIEGDSFEFTIKPGFTQTALFYILATGFFLVFGFLLGYMVLRIRHSYLKKRRIELEIKVHERTKDLFAAKNELISTNNKLTNTINKMNNDLKIRQKIERYLLDSEDRYRRLVELSPDVVVILIDNKFTFVNSAGLELFHVEYVDNLYDKSIYDFVLPDYHIILKEAFAKLSEPSQKNFTIVNCKISGYDNKVSDVEIAAVPFMHQGKAAMQVIIRNITDRKRQEEQISLLAKALAEIKKEDKSELIIGNSNAIKNIYQIIYDIADTDTTVLITGESGTGKELVARAIHNNSSRRDKSFVPINCGAFSETLIDSELFGHEPGSFTGAIKRKIGKFEYASEGTLFLDEIGEISQNLQVKLLRVLQDKFITRLGSNTPIKVNTRIIAATNQNLKEMIEDNKFREDLFYRLNVINIHIPPLRERKEDIPVLTMHFINKFNIRYGKNVKTISTPLYNYINRRSWQGNVRELENFIEKCMILNKTDVLEYYPEAEQERSFSENINGGYYDITSSLKYNLEMYEKSIILETLVKYDGSVSKTAKELGMGRNTLYRKIDKYEIEVQNNTK